MARSDDSGSDVDPASDLLVCNAIHSRERDAGSIRKRLPRPVNELDVFFQSHTVSIPINGGLSTANGVKGSIFHIR